MTEKELVELRDSTAKKRDFLTLSDDFVTNMIFNSLSFEHGIGTKKQVAHIICDDYFNCDPKYVKLVKNVQNALMYVVKMVKNNEDLTEDSLKDIHQLLMTDIGLGGLYRNVDISIKGSNHTPCSYLKVYDRMHKYFDTLNGKEINLETIAYSHLQLAKIHPFLDGNGRCARLVMNYYLLKAGYAPITIPFELKDEYFSCLESFKVDKDIKPFIEFISKLEEEELLK